MMRYCGSITVLACALTVGACGGLKVSTDYDPEADFSGWQTYVWAERTDEGELDPRVYNSIVEGRVKVAVDRALQAKGYSEVITGDPDFLVAWHGAIDGKVSVNTVTTHYGYGWGWYGGYGATQTYVNEWDEGTLIIDFIDVRENKLVWRSSVTDSITERASPEEAQRALDNAVAKILGSFPPGGGG
jgi:hypothetical protein